MALLAKRTNVKCWLLQNAAGISDTSVDETFRWHKLIKTRMLRTD